MRNWMGRASCNTGCFWMSSSCCWTAIAGGDHFYALNQIVGLHIDIPETLTGPQVVESEPDALAYIGRIRAARPGDRAVDGAHAGAGVARHLHAEDGVPAVDRGGAKRDCGRSVRGHRRRTGDGGARPTVQSLRTSSGGWGRWRCRRQRGARLLGLAREALAEGFAAGLSAIDCAVEGSGAAHAGGWRGMAAGSWGTNFMRS